MEPSTHRLFIGIAIDESTKDDFAAHERFIDPNELSPTTRENIHMTVLFLGDVYDAAIPALKEIIENVCNDTRPFVVTGGRTMIMHPDEPYMLWLRFDRNRWFEDLALKLEKYCWRIGTWKNTRDRKQRRSSGDKFPMPHVTLARVPHGRLLDSLLPPYDATKKMSQVKCNELVLYETTRDGHTDKNVYHELARFEIGK